MNAPLRNTGEAAPVGHNNPPAPTPFELSREEIDGLFTEASHWLDGSGVQSDQDADAVKRLMVMLKEEIATAERRRKDENKPFDEGKAEVQARYNALIGDTKSAKGKAVLALDVCRQALTPWNVAKDEAKRKAAEEAREAADRKAREAALALRMTDTADLGGREQAEAIAREAKAAEAAAKKAERPTATGLRTSYRAEVTDGRAFLNWCAANRPDALRGMLQSYAETLCAQKVRGMAGVTIHEDRRAY